MGTTSRSRPLWRAALLSGLVGGISVVSYGVFASRALVLGLVCGWLFYVALVVGLLLIPPPPRARRSPKIFCLGLSRTGTCSLSVALDELGYSVYHMCFRLLRYSPENPGIVQLNERWAEAFDVQADAPVAAIYQELAKRYPFAKFILTTRDPEEWGQAMAGFVKRYRRLFKYVPYPRVSRVFAATYGADWDVKEPREFSAFYRNYVREVREFFSERGEYDRVLELAICEGEGQARLLEFLGRPVQNKAFARVDVFDLSWNRQPLWQLRNLVQSFSLHRSRKASF